MNACSASKRVVVCVVNWENAPSTQLCVSSILALNDINASSERLAIVVIDNGSSITTKRELNRLSDLGPHVHVLSMSRNLGYAGALNAGIEFASSHYGPEFFWLLNNDTRARQGSLDALCDAADVNQNAAVIGSTIIGEDGRVQCAGGCYYNPWLTTYAPALRGASLSDLASKHLRRPLDYISGAAMFFRATALRDVGLFTEDYFLYFEELDLARRLPSNWDLAWCSSSLISHADGATTSRFHAQSGIDIATYFSTRSALMFTLRYFPRRFVVAALFRFAAKSVQLLVAGRYSSFKLLVAAYRDVFTGKSRMRELMKDAASGPGDEALRCDSDEPR